MHDKLLDWLEELSEYSRVVHYRRRNTRILSIADGLSRLSPEFQNDSAERDTFKVGDLLTQIDAKVYVMKAFRAEAIGLLWANKQMPPFSAGFLYLFESQRRQEELVVLGISEFFRLGTDFLEKNMPILEAKKIRMRAMRLIVMDGVLHRQ